jgi:short-subunit dehydrogenase
MVVLITGVSGGLGRVLGATLASKGLTVYGTMRSPEGHEGEFPFPLLPMNVLDDASVEKCVSQLLEREGRIDVVVNCVNRMFIGTVEEQTVDEVESLYATNVFGWLRLVKAVIPVMRRQRGGTLVTMSSLGGVIAVPTMSAYTSSKFALEAMSEALAHELRDDDIDVVIMQPVAMKMDRPETGDHLSLVQNVGSESVSHRMLRRMASDTEASGLTPEQVSEKVHEVITSKKKPLRVPMDRAKVLSLVKRLAPQSVIDRLVAGLLK